MIDWYDPETLNFLVSLLIGMYIAVFIPIVVLAYLWWGSNKR